MSKVLRIDARDNVLVALEDLPKGPCFCNEGTFHLSQDVPQKHKFITSDLKQNEKVIMYGVPVGKVTSDLKSGSLLTTENLIHFAEEASITARKVVSWNPPNISKFSSRSFDGYHRTDGRVGTANYWLVVPLVFCENRNLKIIEEALTRQLGYHRPNKYESIVVERLTGAAVETAETPKRRFQNVDGIKFLYHQGGCGGTRDDSESLLRLLAGYVHHPNVAGATILSLGCQHAQIHWFQEIEKQMFPGDDRPVYFLEQQQLPSEEALIIKAIDYTLEGLKYANQLQRKEAPLSKLTIGLECGGSDGFSGISANPTLGFVSDLLVSLGGSTLLSEFPELNGVEQNLMDRCISEALAEKFLKLQRTYEQRALAVGSGFDRNPSPGNIKDGLITDAIKSAGAAKKGGTAPVSDVLDYTQQVMGPGLHLLCTPGNDVESTTALASSGANIILFTTGLGTPTGNPVVPVIKVSSNSSLKNRMSDIIDFDTGSIIQGQSTVQSKGEELMDLIIKVASGKETCAMKLEQNDFIPWKRGVSL